MKHPLITALALAALLAGGGAVPARAQGPQQERMKMCNTQANARHLMGGQRRQYMSTCLSRRGGGHMSMNSQQRRMRACSADAKSRGLKGAARKRYMSDCLKGR